jgi:hypothetical protein
VQGNRACGAACGRGLWCRLRSWLAVPLAVVACGRGLRSWLAVVACSRGLQSWLVIVACRDLCGAIAVGHISKEQKHEEKHEKKH